ncbi:MAG: hypothetical protein FWG62_04570, partial [Proteobacteria bacterium]|nr:hypothetical protein [Pseudomonadota bacterium]
MEPITLTTEVKAPFSSRLTGEQQHRLPFTQGQFLLGTVMAKGDARLFTLDLNGQQVTAESSTPLQIGQKLNLQVVAMAPRMELQVLTPGPAERQLGNVLPLLGKEPLLLPQLAAVADDPLLVAQLRPATQETLLFFAGQQAASSASSSPLPVPALINQLAELLVSRPLSAPEPNIQATLQEIVTLLQQAGHSGTLDPKTAAAAGRLANLFSMELTNRPPQSPEQSALAGLGAAGPKETGAALEILATLAEFKPTDSTLLGQLLVLHRTYASLPADNPLQQLLSFMVQTTSDHALPVLAQGA